MAKAYVWILIMVIILISGCGKARLDQKKKHFLHKGNLVFNEKLYQEAIRYYSEAIELDSSFAQAYNNLGIVYFKTGKYDQAIKAYSNCFQVGRD